jgi:site-specific DNA-methyltransferase (adenine-specific)
MTAYIPKSKTDNWATPKDLYDKLDSEFHFDFDPCPITWKEGDADGLSVEWGQSNFVNPPYSKVSDWIKKSYNEWKKGKQVVMLINAITDTKAFHEYILNNAEIRFIKGRIKFMNVANPMKSAPNVKASILVIFKMSSRLSSRRLRADSSP